MKLQYNVFPDFYKRYDWFAEREEDKLFTGREYYLKNFWRNLSNVANNDYSRQNKTFIGQREVFQFWRNHLNEKIHLLNNDPPKHQGATLRLLKYIAEKDNDVHIEKLRIKTISSEYQCQTCQWARKRSRFLWRALCKK